MPEITKLAFAAPLLLSACVTSAQPDPQIAVLTHDISVQSGTLYAALSNAPTPECDYEHNKNFYAQLSTASVQLQAHLVANHASKPLTIAAGALARTIDNAARSHQLASAVTDDPNGSCLAPGAIILNADAIARASTALASAQQKEGSSQ